MHVPWFIAEKLEAGGSIAVTEEKLSNLCHKTMAE